MIDKQATKNPEDINTRIAQRLRTLRAERGLSLDTLATKSTVSRAMISLIERGESSPTAAVLDKIANGLGVPLASLFNNPIDDAEKAAPNPVSHAKNRSTWRDPESGYLRCNISPPHFPSPLQLVEVELPAGASVSYESTPQSIDIHQQIWIQEGKLEIRFGNQHFRLTTGDCLAMQVNLPTIFHNPSRRRVRYIVAVASFSSTA